MKRKTLFIKKWFVRALMTAGAALGIAACSHTKPGNNPGPAEAVYGPPPEADPRIEVIEDVYGPPPVPDIDDDTIQQVPEVIDRPKVYGPPPVSRKDSANKSPKVRPLVYGPPPVGKK